MKYAIPIAIIAAAIFAGTAPAEDFGGEIRLRPYAEWVKTSPAKSLLQYVRETVASLVNGQSAAPPEEDRFPWLQQPAGVFVTAMKGRKVRSCVGAFIPKESTLAKEIYQQCKRLAAEDIRHTPLAPGELESLRFVISFTGNPATASDPFDLDIWREGLLMRWNGREAVLLPGEAKTLSWGIGELRRQIQIPEAETPSYAVFPVVILQEPPPIKKP
jgi:AMMECR1 domain-containing protein